MGNRTKDTVYTNDMRIFFADGFSDKKHVIRPEAIEIKESIKNFHFANRKYNNSYKMK